MKQIQTAVAEAQAEGKYVFCQVGGNWCPWCIRFASFVENDTIIKPIMDSNFVYIHVNWSRDNKNPEALKFLGNPGRFGFPVFVIIDEKGKPIHIQNSAYLEQDKELEYYVPEDGSNIWYDAWTLPKGSNKELAYTFLNYLSDPKNAADNMDYIDYIFFAIMRY